jgi:undecaprenyl-diphosphatase
MSALTYPEMIVVGLLQGVSELFPVSSLGHSVLLPALVGGKWGNDLDMSADGSAYLDALVAMHVATAAALVLFFIKDWVRIIGGLFTSIRYRRVSTPYERLAWLLVLATIPVGLAGVALDDVMQKYFARPVPVAAFLAVNGVVLFTVERLHRRQRVPAQQPAARQPAPPAGSYAMADAPTMVLPVVPSPHDATVQLPVIPPGRPVPGGVPPAPPAEPDPAAESDVRLSKLRLWEAIAVGACQILALLPGISRSGITMTGGLLRGLRHEDAARFAFLLATPVIAAAGVLKIPELAQPEMRGSAGPVLVGSLVAGVCAYFSVRFLTRYFETRTLTPFAIYCVVLGLGSLAWFGLT